eukprot:3616110-Rhodomonas_salina.1
MSESGTKTKQSRAYVLACRPSTKGGIGPRSIFGMQCAVLRWSINFRHSKYSLCEARGSDRPRAVRIAPYAIAVPAVLYGLRACYALRGTDLAYAATRCGVQHKAGIVLCKWYTSVLYGHSSRYAMPGTDLANAAMLPRMDVFKIAGAYPIARRWLWPQRVPTALERPRPL